eukprot:CAMPEP_0196735552 /NCGR_PEP_ID=MMETSP1091-20130531/13955_1 /TAXON_ID=302021 /ORGANISM="Rhodomonas sp., Strain CCMP768" /LENGTH=97 /DNA_ID=CAMNT_0042079203 /DNA_START=471 /DNA_END=764 /DNA_ORIENTATION=+
MAVATELLLLQNEIHDLSAALTEEREVVECVGMIEVVSAALRKWEACKSHPQDRSFPLPPSPHAGGGGAGLQSNPALPPSVVPQRMEPDSTFLGQHS